METIVKPSISDAMTIKVPENLEAEAFVIKGERAALWEKQPMRLFWKRWVNKKNT